jgi:hypothetical protein
MTSFYRAQQVPAPDSIIPAALGASAGAKLTSLDQYKIVKLLSNGAYGLAASGDDIEGQLVSVEAYTVNDGFGRGGVQQHGTITVTVEGGTLAVGAYVVCGTVVALGTALTAVSSGAQTNVKAPKVIAGNGAIIRWRICSLLGGAGTVGTNVLIERVV